MLAIESPFPQFFDSNGQPLDAGQLFVGQPGQNPITSPAPVFWDLAGTQPASQPIPTLNGYPVRGGTPSRFYTAGDFSLLIRSRKGKTIAYLSSAATGKHVKEERQTATAGQTVFTLTNVNYVPGVSSLMVFVNGLRVTGYEETAANTVTFSQAMVGGEQVDFLVGAPVNAGVATLASGVTFTPPGAGKQTTVQNKLTRRVELLDYVADEFAAVFGTEDIGPALTKAAAALPRGGRIDLPPGLLNVATDPAFSGKAIHLVGQGASNSTSRGTVLQIAPGASLTFTNAAGSSLQDMLITGNGAHTSGYLVVFDNAYNAGMRGVQMRDGFNGLWLKQVNTFRARDCVLANFSGEQVVLLNGVSDAKHADPVEWTNCTISAGSANPNTDNLVLDGQGGSMKLVGCAVLFGRHGVWMRNTTGGSAPRFLYVTGGGFENAQGSPIKLDAGSKVFIGGAAYISSDGPESGIDVGPTFQGEGVVTGAYIRGNGRHGIDIQSPGWTIVGARIVNNAAKAGSASVVNVANCANNGSGLIRVTTATAHGARTGDRVRLASVTGTTEANGDWTCTVIDGTTLDLQGSAFVNAYVSGGNSRILAYGIRIRPGVTGVRVEGCSGGQATDGGLNRQAAAVLDEGTGNSIELGERAFAKLGQFILSPTDYGAVGDWNGTTGTDNLAAFNACYSDAVVLAAAGFAVRISIPRGRYRLSDEWNVYRVNSPRRDIIIQGEDQLSTRLVAGFYGAGKALIKCVDPAGLARSSPTSIRDLGFENFGSAGVNPVYIWILGWGESRMERVRFASTNNSVIRGYGMQNIRMTDIVAFNAGRNFNYKNTAGFTFSVDTGTKTITASGAIFSAADVGKHFFVFPADVTRRIRYTVASYVSPTQVTYSEANGLTETSQPGHFEPARCSMGAGSSTLTANASVFSADMVGLVLYVRAAKAGTAGAALLRGVITGYTSPTQVTLSVTADNAITDQFFAVAAVDFGRDPNMAASSDVKIDKLQVETYSGVALVTQNTDGYHITSSKLHGAVNVTDTVKSMAAAWLDGHGGMFSCDLDSSCSMSDARVYVCNLGRKVLWDSPWSRSVANGRIFKSELITDPVGCLEVRGINVAQSVTTPVQLADDANAAADPTDPRIIFTGLVAFTGTSQKPRNYVGRDAYFEPDGRFRPHKSRSDTAIASAITWNGTPPSGASTLRYRWEQIGSVVLFEFRLEYATPGASNSTLSIALPADMPPPLLMSGTGTGEILSALQVGFIGTGPTAAPALCKSWLIEDGAGGYKLDVVLNSGTISAAFAATRGYYWTA